MNHKKLIEKMPFLDEENSSSLALLGSTSGNGKTSIAISLSRFLIENTIHQVLYITTEVRPELVFQKIGLKRFTSRFCVISVASYNDLVTQIKRSARYNGIKFIVIDSISILPHDDINFLNEENPLFSRKVLIERFHQNQPYRYSEPEKKSSITFRPQIQTKFMRFLKNFSIKHKLKILLTIQEHRFLTDTDQIAKLSNGLTHISDVIWSVQSYGRERTILSTIKNRHGNHNPVRIHMEKYSNKIIDIR